MRHKLKWLTVVAGMGLLSLVVLQIYWLRTAYKEQERVFIAHAENTLLSSMMHNELSKMTGKDTLLRDVLKSIPLDEILSSARAQMKDIPENRSPDQEIRLKLNIPDSLVKNPEALKKLLAELKDSVGDNTIMLSDRDTADVYSVDDERIQSYKRTYDELIRNKGYHITSEMAIVDSNMQIQSASIDTAAFRRIRIKTSLDAFGVPVEKMGKVIQVAFPNITMELLRRMATILSISLLIILICVSSTTYLLILFFKQKRVSEIKNDFMNNMTHELKTPISSVSVAIELMNDAGKRGEPDAMKDYLEIAQGELNRLTMLVEKVLKIAAFEKSDISIRKENFLVAAWLQQISNSFKPIFETSGVTYSAKVKPELLMLNGDKTHLTNVLQNLIDNALKYNDKPTPFIDVIIQETDSDIYLMVKDNGKGISTTHQAKIFDKFFRVPSGNVHDVKGYGLGLSYVKEIVALHNGQIQIESVLNQGSTFIITLPK